MIMKHRITKRRIFEAHGVVFADESGDQLIGYCPFSNREGKFYVNKKTWLWDSKTAGVSGNIYKFLALSASRYEKIITPDQLKTLGMNRELPTSAFKEHGIGWDDVHEVYTLPIRDVTGTVVDIRYCKLGGRMMSTPGANVGLWNAHTLKIDPAAPVYICEGEWDGIALAWLLKKIGNHGLVIAVPGAGIFKPDWVPWLSGRIIHSLYDHDEAGHEGEHVLLKRLWNSVQRMTFVHWPQDMPSGFDVRDWIIRHIEDDKLDQAYPRLVKLFKVTPQTEFLAQKQNDGSGQLNPANTGPSDKPSRWKQPPTLDDVMRVFTKWLHLENTDAIRIMLATVVSQAMDGPPVWTFLVGPPGSAKTAVLASLNTYPKVYSTSSLTVHALISGASGKDTADPSLIPRLNGKIVVVKDFTSILSMRDAEKDEIFGILRDAFDGRCGKVFGNGVERNYISRFTILAAVTPRIYDISSQHTALGERFLKFAVGDNLHHVEENEIIARAIQNINSEAKMNDEFQDVVSSFLERQVKLDHVPSIPDHIEKRIVALARFGARMRGSVTRDSYRNDIMTSRPSAEIGSRLGIQLAKLGKALAMVVGRQHVGLEEYRLLKKTMLDTIPQRNEDLVRHLIKLGGSAPSHMLTEATRYPGATIQRLLQDMHVLDIMMRKGSAVRAEWTLSPYMARCVKEAELYQKGTEELKRKTRLWVRIVRTQAS